MAYLALPLKAGKEAYGLLKESREPDWESLEKPRGQGPRIEVGPLVREADEICDEFPLPLADGAAAELEGRLGVALHEHLSDPQAVIDPDFWRWMAFRPLRPAVLHRHQGSSMEMPNGDNFGIGRLVENFPYRAWARAAIGFDPTAAPSKRYDLAVRGDQDFWRSHLLRPRYAFARSLAHALIKFQYPDKDERSVLAPGQHKNGVRLLAKRLSRFQANCVLPLLTEDQCSTLLDMLADGLTRADGTTYSSRGMS